MNRVEQMKKVQEQALAFYELNWEVPRIGSADHVVVMGIKLKIMLDSETRHVTLGQHGLSDSLVKLFVECVCALRGQNIDLDDGRRRKVPLNFGRACELLRVEVFAPKNEDFGDSFGDYGAVGVVIRLLDQVSRLERRQRNPKDPVETIIAHITNYTVMALMLLVENDSEFLL